MGLSRLALHAGIVTMKIDSKPMTIHSPLPSDLQQVFSELPWWKELIDQNPLLIHSKID